MPNTPIVPLIAGLARARARASDFTRSAEAARAEADALLARYLAATGAATAPMDSPIEDCAQ